MRDSLSFLTFGLLKQFLLRQLSFLLLSLCFLFHLQLVQLPLVVLSSLCRQRTQILPEVDQAHGTSSMKVEAVIIFGGLVYSCWFPVEEKHRLRNIDRTAHVGTFRTPSKFLNKPAIVLLFIAVVVSLAKLDGTIVLNSLQLLNDSFLQVKIASILRLFDLL